MKINRLQKIVNYVNEMHSVKNEELCEKFKISIQTLRRDLKTLEDQGQLKKVYGGVVSNGFRNQHQVSTLENRDALYVDEKNYIGKLAASLVEDNDVIFIDSGTTIVKMLPYLKSKQDLTIITHALNVMEELRAYQNIHFIALGGPYDKHMNTFQFSPSTFHYHVNKAFIATVGISITYGLSNTDFLEGEIKKLVIENADKTIVLCDSSKFSTNGFNQFAAIEDINIIVSDQHINEKVAQTFREQGIDVIYK